MTALIEGNDYRPGHKADRNLISIQSVIPFSMKPSCDVGSNLCWQKNSRIGVTVALD